MSYKTFNEWMLFRDIFGFERSKNLQNKKRESDDPITRLKTDIIVDELMRHTIRHKRPHRDFEETITWGEVCHGEAIRLDISPLGSLKIIIRKSMNDFEGNNTWICKEIRPLPNEENNQNEYKIVGKVLDDIKKIDGVIDSPATEYDLEKLSLDLAEEIKRSKPCRQMVFHKIKKLSNEHYLICMEMTGSGMEAPSQMRVEQFQINMFFDKSRGIIRSYASDIASPTRSHKWMPQPSEWDEHFAPTQDRDEIVSAIVNALSTY